MVIKTPRRFSLRTNHTYPPHNNQIFEEYFYDYFINHSPEVERHYLPILWTNFYLSRGNGSGFMKDIQDFLDSLDKSKKYFTVLQYDDGILQDLSDLDIQVFCGGGGGQREVAAKNLGYPIPLLCQPNNKINKERSRDLKASFVGALNKRHHVRDVMKKELSNYYLIQSSLGYEQFKDIMERSVFALCPRGYGATSFRICEALQHGAIPVYFYDKDWSPWPEEFDFQEIGFKVQVDEIKNLPQLLASQNEEDVKCLRERGELIYNQYFTYEGCAQQIIKKLQ